MRAHFTCSLQLSLLVLAVGGATAPALCAAATSSPSPTGITPLARPGDSVQMLPFSDFFKPGPRELLAVPALKALNDRRVRVVGYMAEMEVPVPGSFFLAARPVQAAEGGAGTGDLPPSVIRVLVRSAAGKPIGHMPGPLSATGLFKVGSYAHTDGHFSYLTLILDRPEDLKDVPESVPIPASASAKSPGKAAPAAVKASPGKIPVSQRTPHSKEISQNVPRTSSVDLRGGARPAGVRGSARRAPH